MAFPKSTEFLKNDNVHYRCSLLMMFPKEQEFPQTRSFNFKE